MTLLSATFKMQMSAFTITSNMRMTRRSHMIMSYIIYSTYHTRITVWNHFFFVTSLW